MLLWSPRPDDNGAAARTGGGGSIGPPRGLDAGIMGSSIEKDLDELSACIGWSIGNVDAPVVVLEGEAKSPKSSSSRKELGFEADWAKGAPRLREGGRCRECGGCNWTFLNLWTGLSSWRLANLEKHV